MFHFKSNLFHQSTFSPTTTLMFEIAFITFQASSSFLSVSFGGLEFQRLQRSQFNFGVSNSFIGGRINS